MSNITDPKFKAFNMFIITYSHRISLINYKKSSNQIGLSTVRLSESH